MKEYLKSDADGEKRIIEKDNGIIIEILEKPSPEYISKINPSLPEIKPRDYLSEIDELKARVSALEKK